MKIVDVDLRCLVAPAFTLTISGPLSRGAGHDGMFYTGDPVTQGFPLCAAGGRVHFRDAGAGRRADRLGRLRSRAVQRRRRPGPPVPGGGVYPPD